MNSKDRRSAILQRFTRKLLLLLGVLCLLSGSTPAQDFKTVYDGVEYAEVTRDVAGLPVRMNLLRLDLTKVRLDVVHAMDAAISTEKTSSIATRHGAVAAINAGFFRLDTSIFAGDAAGVLMIDNSLYSESVNGRVALMIDDGADRTEVYIERADVSGNFTVKRADFAVGTNRERKAEDLVDLHSGVSSHDANGQKRRGVCCAARKGQANCRSGWRQYHSQRRIYHLSIRQTT